MIADCPAEMHWHSSWSRAPGHYNHVVTWRFLLVGLAAVALLLPLPPAIVERHYSASLFPRLQGLMTSASNLTAVALFDLLVVVTGAAVLLLSLQDLAKHRPTQAALRIAGRLVTVAAATCLAFVLLWGLNYRRTPMRERVPFDRSRITVAAATGLGRDATLRVNALHAAAHASGWPPADAIDPALARSFAHTLPALNLPATIVPARPKRSLLDLYFRRAGVAGMTDPFFLETLMASDILPFERPHVVAHEWAHLAGVTDEGEANFVGWLACVRGTVPQQYSGWLFLYSEVLAGLSREDARQVSALLAGGPRADLQALRERARREVSPRISGAGWQVYDQYLKANRIEAGTASYAQVVQLVLGTELR